MLILSVSDPGGNLPEEVPRRFPQYQFQFTPGQMRVESEEAVNISPLIRFLEERAVQVTEARRHLPSLEDVFVQVTGIEAGLMRKEKEKAAGGGNQ